MNAVPLQTNQELSGAANPQYYINPPIGKSYLSRNYLLTASVAVVGFARLVILLLFILRPVFEIVAIGAPDPSSLKFILLVTYKVGGLLVILIY